MKKDATKTKKKILKAVGSILSEKGFDKIGINEIARKANVSKVLIYRYFGGLDELLEIYAMTADHWPSIEEQLAGHLGEELAKMEFEKIGSILIGGLIQSLENRPITQEIMKWEMLSQNKLTDMIADIREKRGQEIFCLLEDQVNSFKDIDMNAFIAIIYGGIQYLILRSKTFYGTFAGIDLQSKRDWKRLEKTAQSIFYAVSQAYQIKK